MFCSGVLLQCCINVSDPKTFKSFFKFVQAVVPLVYLVFFLIKLKNVFNCPYYGALSVSRNLR